MNIEEVKEHIKDKIENFKSMHRIMQDDYGKGAIEALEGLLHEIEMMEEQE
ncbi:hypothetical protein SAMN04487943_101326 [Gracilibacillus orientalis]|uniref:Uncharacterized protein n=1 Tax=Gracilibacillus orientalis TaxID=334253 RepID=A0A1I4HD53_9BACI|nr:hypothetical protein [Gracilibacillus orientalis]SFL39366.1 hypothetical protein SAMN04487943_101326 [Gracilibacillus orientalis]